VYVTPPPSIAPAPAVRISKRNRSSSDDHQHRHYSSFRTRQRIMRIVRRYFSVAVLVAIGWR